MTPTLRHGVTETEVEARIRLGRDVPATVPRLYPAQPPYAGHPEDALFNEAGTSFHQHAWGWREKAVLMFMGAVAILAVLGILRGL